ncbi:MAG: hypothetical protein ACKOXP_04505 [Flavobacteriales bacterium]
MKTTIFLFVLLTTLFANGQNNEFRFNECDSSFTIFKYPNALNFIKNEKIIKGYDVYQIGLAYKGEPIGMWKLYNVKNDKLIGLCYYNNSTPMIEYHIKRGRIVSEVHLCYEPGSDSTFFISKIVSYNFFGAIKKESFTNKPILKSKSTLKSVRYKNEN